MLLGYHWSQCHAARAPWEPVPNSLGNTVASATFRCSGTTGAMLLGHHESTCHVARAPLEPVPHSLGTTGASAMLLGHHRSQCPLQPGRLAGHPSWINIYILARVLLRCSPISGGGRGGRGGKGGKGGKRSKCQRVYLLIVFISAVQWIFGGHFTRC